MERPRIVESLRGGSGLAGDRGVGDLEVVKTGECQVKWEIEKHQSKKSL